MEDQPGRTENDKITIDGDGNVIGNNNQVTVIKNAPAQLTSLHQIRPPPRDFTGRDGDISKILAEFKRGAAIVGLFGMGGVGKTDLALVLAHNLKKNFSDAQFFIDMQGTSNPALTPEGAMAHVIHSYDATARLPENQSELQGQYISVLQGKKALILLDNAAGREQVEPLLPPAGCCMLITSRHKFALKGMKAIDLNVLSPEDARSLLLANSDRIGDNADKLAELCGRLPLALRNAAYLLAERVDLDVTEYIDRLNDARKRLDLVDASFDLSYNLLTPDLRDKWSMLSIFPADFDRAGGAAVSDIDLEQAVDDLGELVRWSLVNFYPSATPAEGRYRLHDLARLFADSHLDPRARIDGQLRHAEYYKNLLSAANALYLKGGQDIQVGLALFDREWANIQAGWAWAERNLMGNNAAVTLCNAFLDWPYLLELRIHPRELISWMETALAAARQLKIKKMEGVHLGNLGNAYADLGEPRKAIEYHDQALKIVRDLGDRRNEGNALGSLGRAYSDLGETRKAIEYHDQALKIVRDLGDRRNEGNALGNLGNAYQNLGEPRKAIEYHDQALKIAREIGGRRGEGAHLGNLGLAYAALGEPRKAIEHHEQALTIAREIGDRRGEGADLGNLGNAYYALGEPRKAIEHYDQALKIAQEIGDLRGEGALMGNLGNAYADLGESVKAIDYYNQALKITQVIGDRRNEGALMGNLGLAYAALGESVKAIDYYDQALMIAQEIGDRRGEGAWRGNLGSAYARLGETRKAIEHYELALTIARKIGDRQGEGNHLGNLGSAYKDLGEPRKAIENYDQALKIAREIGDRKGEGNHLGNLGNAYADLGETRKAIEYYQQQLKITQEIGDKRGEGNALFNMSLELDGLGKRSEAVKLAKQARQIYEQIESPNAERVRRKLAEWQG